LTVIAATPSSATLVAILRIAPLLRYQSSRELSRATSRMVRSSMPKPAAIISTLANDSANMKSPKLCSPNSRAMTT